MGNYVVQSLSVSSIQRSLLIKFPIEIMCSSKCSSQFFFYKIHSVISNSTFHNVNVKKKHVFEDEGIEENTQKLLSCNVHPVILFPKKVKELCGDILAIIGKKKNQEKTVFSRHSVSFRVIYSKILNELIKLYKERYFVK